MYVYGRVKLCP